MPATYILVVKYITHNATTDKIVRISKRRPELELKKLDYKEELITGLKARDRRSQYRFYQTYCDAMYNICMRMLVNRLDAEDVLQKSFMDAYLHIDSYNYTATPGAWLKRITINNCINLLRKNRMEMTELENHHEVLVEHDEHEQDHYNIDVIKKCMNDLPEGYRIVINLYLLEGYDHREIGEILNISESTSKSQYSRARKKLRQLLNNNKTELYQ